MHKIYKVWIPVVRGFRQDDSLRDNDDAKSPVFTTVTIFPFRLMFADHGQANQAIRYETALHDGVYSGIFAGDVVGGKS